MDSESNKLYPWGNTSTPSIEWLIEHKGGSAGSWYSYSDSGWRNNQGFGGTDGHLGADLKKDGDPENRAIYEGKVIAAGFTTEDGNGYCVTIEHEVDGVKFYSFYAHMKKDSIKVEVGDIVKAGDAVGTMGNTGNSKGAHLHLGVYTGKKPNNTQYGYKRDDKYKKLPFDSSDGYEDYKGFTFYDPIEVIKTKGQIIVESEKNK